MGNRKATIMQLAKGFRGRRKNCYRITVHAVHRALKYAYVSRRLRKRENRRTWIMQINAGSKEHGLSYGKLIYGLIHAEIGVNRKMLALLAQQEPQSFRAIVEEAKLALSKIVLPPGTSHSSEGPLGGADPEHASPASIGTTATGAAAEPVQTRVTPANLIELAKEMAEQGELSDALESLAISEGKRRELHN